MDTVSPNRPTHHGRIMFGILIMTFGVLMLVERLEIARVHLTSQFWPFFPLALGLVRFIDPPARRDGGPCSPRSAAWLIFIGLWGLANEFHFHGLDYHNSWPLVIVFAGINIVWRSIEEPAPRQRDERRQS